MKKIRVLLADDSDKLLTALRIQLEARGFEIETCSDSYMALARAQKLRPDVMVLDIRMPAGDGFSVLERMKNIPEIRDIPVIFITGDQSFQLDLRAEELGAVGLIHKPISISVLFKMLNAAAFRKQAQIAGTEEAEILRLGE
ncbi:MAG TPA: response regulator [Tepidisphaeraceae bacterium]|nr:response regulator [Tepidisphaeraceae bacterium]